MLRWIFLIGIAYIGLLSILFFFQEQLLYFPQRLSPERSAALHSRNDPESLELRMSDGTTVRGWLVKNPSQTPLRLLFYYGGNAEELSRMIDDSGKFRRTGLWFSSTIAATEKAAASPGKNL